MRQILVGDIIAAARSLLDVPPSKRANTLSEILFQAHAADKITKRTGMPHKTWGNGSLMAAAAAKQSEPFLSDPAFLDVLRLTVDGLIAWKHANQASHRRHER
jgi:hypothetical protein